MLGLREASGTAGLQLLTTETAAVTGGNGTTGRTYGVPVRNGNGGAAETAAETSRQ